jgi:FkbM family methyltransferase
MFKLPRRFDLLAQWARLRMAGQAADVPFGEMLALLASPSWRTRVNPFVTRIDPPGEDGLEALWLKGSTRPLWWPAEMGQDMLYQLVAEQLDPINWHRYQMQKTRLAAEDVVVDCGASEGLFSFLAAPIVREVHAIEPLPRFVQCLRKTFADEPKVSLVHALLGQTSGQGRIAEGGVGTCVSAEGTLEVPMHTLDELFLDHEPAITYIKADLEGFELPMLRGAAGLIERHLPRMSLTTYHSADDAGKMEAWLREASGGRYHFQRRGLTVDGFSMMLHVWAPRDPSA